MGKEKKEKKGRRTEVVIFRLRKSFFFLQGKKKTLPKRNMERDDSMVPSFKTFPLIKDFCVLFFIKDFIDVQKISNCVLSLSLC